MQLTAEQPAAYAKRTRKIQLHWRAHAILHSAEWCFFKTLRCLIFCRNSYLNSGAPESSKLSEKNEPSWIEVLLGYWFEDQKWRFWKWVQRLKDKGARRQLSHQYFWIIEVKTPFYHTNISVFCYFALAIFKTFLCAAPEVLWLIDIVKFQIITILSILKKIFKNLHFVMQFHDIVIKFYVFKITFKNSIIFTLST